MALIFFLLFPVTNLSAQESSYFWEFDDETTNLIPHLKNALDQKSQNQVFGLADLKKNLESRVLKTPPCLLGTQKCESPFTIALHSLELSGVVKLKKTKEGFLLLLFDGRKELITEYRVQEEDLKRASFKIVSKLFNAMGTVVFVSTPEGAEVKINGEKKGITPFHVQVPIGDFQYTISLNQFSPIDERASVNSGELKEIDVRLSALPSYLTITNAPEGAEVFANGERVGFSGEGIELLPGDYSIQIRKEGYHSLLETLSLEAGQHVEKSASMERSNPLLRDVTIEAIAHRKFILRISYEHGFQRATFQDARSGSNSLFMGLADNDGKLGIGEPVQRSLQTNGARLELQYHLRNFGVTLASLSLLNGTTSYDGFVLNNEGKREAVQVVSSNRLQLRPFQLSYRRFYKNFVPSVDLGLGVDFHWFNAELENEELLSFQRSEAFWTFGLSGQFFLTNSFFGILHYSYQDYFVSGPGADHQFSLGLGIAFGNLFGFDPEPPEQL